MLCQFMTDIQQRLEDKVRISEGGGEDCALDMYNGLNMKREHTIFFKLSTHPILNWKKMPKKN